MAGLRSFWVIPVALLTSVGGLALGVRFHENILNGLAGRPLATSTVPTTTQTPATGPAMTALTSDDVIKYRCGMHPNYIQAGPGNCPICGMVLEPFHTHGDKGSSVTIDPTMVQNMGVRTAMPIVGRLSQTIRAVGTLTEPEQNHREINLRVNGWIQKLYANQEGMQVKEGDPLFELYSPEITAAADELISARKLNDTTTGGGEAAGGAALKGVLLAGRRKLELLGLSTAQVAAIEKLDQAPATVMIVSPMHGHIAEKKIIEGSAVKAGDELMKIADRSTMWMIVQVFEQQLGQVKAGAKVRATVSATPGKEYEGTVDFVYPHLDPSTRTAQVRVVIPNASHELHENMFAEAVIEGAGGDNSKVLVPREAVMDSGVRQIVFLDLGKGKFEPRDVKVGRSGVLKDVPEGGSNAAYVEILAGVSETDSIVTSGQFLLDSESRAQEAFNKLGSPTATMPGGAMPGMDMGGGL